MIEDVCSVSAGCCEHLYCAILAYDLRVFIVVYFRVNIRDAIVRGLCGCLSAVSPP